LGATTIGSASRAPDEMNTRIMKLGRQEDSIFEPIVKKTFDYSLGVYYHREHWSCTRWRWETSITDRNNHRLHCQQYQLKWYHYFTTIRRDLQLIEKQLDDFRHWNSQTRLRIKFMILELSHRDKSLNVVIVKIMKVRPQDPSCMA
jgi:hypothetical protein